MYSTSLSALFCDTVKASLYMMILDDIGYRSGCSMLWMDSGTPEVDRIIATQGKRAAKSDNIRIDRRIVLAALVGAHCEEERNRSITEFVSALFLCSSLTFASVLKPMFCANRVLVLFCTQKC